MKWNTEWFVVHDSGLGGTNQVYTHCVLEDWFTFIMMRKEMADVVVAIYFVLLLTISVNPGELHRHKQSALNLVLLLNPYQLKNTKAEKKYFAKFVFINLCLMFISCLFVF